MKQTIMFTVLGLFLFSTPFLQAQTRRGSKRLERPQAGQASKLISKDDNLTATSSATVFARPNQTRSLYFTSFAAYAFDIILSSANLSVLRPVARSMGGRVLAGPCHYHVEN